MSPNPVRKTIMVIDDSEIVLAVARTSLEAAGYRVVTQARAAGTVALILQEKPELVLLDVNMPSVGGDTIAKLFGKAQPHSETIVLLHSSLPAETLRVRALASGAHGYVQKSDDPFDLVRHVTRWLKQGPHTPHGRHHCGARAEADEPPSSSPSGALTAEKPARAKPAPNGSDGSRASDAARTVLFIDDDMTQLSGFRRVVQAEPYSVEFALSGSHALKRILSPTPPALVVSDLLMPEPSGIEVYRQATAADMSLRERFLFVTGASLLDEVSKFLATFRGIVLRKPVEGEALKSAIRRGLSHRA